MQDELDPVLDELAQMPGPKIGFHIRGGDKLSEDVQLVSRWKPQVLRLQFFCLVLM